MDAQDAILVAGVSKIYRLWHEPATRAKYVLTSGLAQLLRRPLTTESESRYFRTFSALRDVSLRVRSGESLAIIGRNGSGKSSLLQIIAGTLQPTTGEVRVHGRVAALLELGSGFNPEFTGRENVFLNAAVLGLSHAETATRFDQIAAFAEIGDFIDQPVKTYSSGMLVRLAFAVMAHVDADILIIDEALSVGDAYFAQKCVRFLRQHQERGHSLLFVSHDLSAVRSFCQNALWLEHGGVRMLGPAKDVAACYLAELNLAPANRLTPGSDPCVSVGTTPSGSGAPAAHHLPKPFVDNPLSISEFSTKSSSFGDGAVVVVGVWFADEQGVPIRLIRGGELVRLCIAVEARETTPDLIVGFNLMDRLGQYLFGENTFHALGGSLPQIAAGERLTAEFVFQMPVLHRGGYGLATAVASGTQDAHRQQHWVHEALILESTTKWAHAGLIGLPMASVSIKRPGAQPTLPAA